MNELTVEAEAKSEVHDAILASIQTEIDEDTHKRSKIKIKSEKDKIILQITAKDLTALRAAANTYLRYLDMALKLAR
jgi:tRNA threonylcarbamoyladenosine modification (KEOPS) complex  Pcc1 subunit